MRFEGLVICDGIGRGGGDFRQFEVYFDSVERVHPVLYVQAHRFYVL